MEASRGIYFYLFILSQVNKDLKQHCQDFNALARELGVDVESCNIDVWTSEVRDHAKRTYGKLIILVLICALMFGPNLPFRALKKFLR